MTLDPFQFDTSNGFVIADACSGLGTSKLGAGTTGSDEDEMMSFAHLPLPHHFSIHLQSPH